MESLAKESQAILVALACIGYLAKTIYELVRSRQASKEGTLSPEQLRQVSEIVALAVSRNVAELLSMHEERAERQLERLISIETNENERTSRVERMLERLASVSEIDAQRGVEHFRTTIQRLDTVEGLIRDQRRVVTP